MNVVIAIILAVAGLAQALSCNSTEHACVSTSMSILINFPSCQFPK